MRDGVDPMLLRAWLAGRSVARGLPAPVADRGGYRIDTNDAAEVARWVFPRMGDGLVGLARSIDRPGHLLKLCGDAAALRSALPDRWQLHPPAWFMIAGRPADEPPPPAGYRIETRHDGAVVTVRIRSADGEPAAIGHAAQTPDAFVYDRIATEAAHRRRGLGTAVMAALRRAKRNPDTPELLVATTDGHALYAALGWRTVSPYSTASVAGATGGCTAP